MLRVVVAGTVLRTNDKVVRALLAERPAEIAGCLPQGRKIRLAAGEAGRAYAYEGDLARENRFIDPGAGGQEPSDDVPALT